MTRSVLVGAVVVVHAVVQTLLLIGDPVPAGDISFLLRAGGSAVAAIAGLTLLTMLVTPSRRVRAILLTVTVTVMLAVAAALIHPAAPAVVLLLGAAVLPAAAVGRSARLGAGAGRHPFVGSLWALGTVAVLALTWAFEALAGFLLDAPAASLLSWLVDGTVVAAVLAANARLLRHTR